MNNNKESEKASETAKYLGLGAMLAVGTYGIYWLFKKKVIPCTPGATKCMGYNLYTCNAGGEWELTESNSLECGYVPEQWFSENQELGRKAFAVTVVTGGWVKDNEEMGSKTFSVVVIDAGWRGENEELGTKALYIPIVDTGWRGENEELGSKIIAINVG